MSTITVEVKSHHMKGNSYRHGVRDNMRKCPLFEALEEAGHKPVYVGSLYATFGDRQQHSGELPAYAIDTDKWNVNTVEGFIRSADGGSQESVTLTLEKTEIMI